MALSRKAAVSLCVLLALSTLAVVGVEAKGKKPCRILWKKPFDETITVRPNTTCTWVWDDNEAHCVTPKKPNPDNMAPSPQLTGKGKEWKYTFKNVGTFKIRCCTHIGTMKLEVIVKKGGKKKKKAQVHA